jgi:hypothetical protein
MHSSFSMASAAAEIRQELISARKKPTTKQVFIFMVLKASCNFLSYAVLADPFVSEILKTGYTELVPYPTNPALTARHGKIAAPRDKPWGV